MARTNSPLRYPGGKSCLFNLTSTIITSNNLRWGNYAEPYAGGCGLALSLLYNGLVADIHINDVDPAIWSFWHSVLHFNDDFVEKLESVPVTVETWKEQREVYKNKTGNPLELGFAAFFLNRTNRSGIIKDAGVLGGASQVGLYKIDCRYNRHDLVKRVKRVAKYANRIHLSKLDALDFMKNVENDLPDDTFLFIDPPYYRKGADLYTNFYRKGDHQNVANAVLSLHHPYLLTYDDTPEIRQFYKMRRQYKLGINYSVQQKRLGAELLIPSEKMIVPEALQGCLIKYCGTSGSFLSS